MVLTLNDINVRFPETMDGDLYSDLYKSVHGFRPRGMTFETMEDFESSWKYLQEEGERVWAEEKEAQAKNVTKFEMRVLDTMNLLKTDRKHAIEVIAEAEECYDEYEGKKYYDFDALEFELNLPYGHLIKEFGMRG